MEYLDVLDSKGNPTGEKKPKPDVHRDGDWHKAVHIWIVNSKGELLLQKRAAIKDSYPNMWDISSAGHISAGEDVSTALLREIREELGLTPSLKDFEYLFTVTQEAVTNGGKYINNEFNDVYLLKLDLDIPKLKLQEEEISEVKWMPYKEYESAIASGSKDFVHHSNEEAKLFPELHKRYP